MSLFNIKRPSFKEFIATTDLCGFSQNHSKSTNILKGIILSSCKMIECFLIPSNDKVKYTNFEMRWGKISF